MDTDSTCHQCDTGIEDVLHISWHCRKAQDIWKKVLHQADLDTFNAWSTETPSRSGFKGYFLVANGEVGASTGDGGKGIEMYSSSA